MIDNVKSLLLSCRQINVIEVDPVRCKASYAAGLVKYDQAFPELLALAGSMDAEEKAFRAEYSVAVERFYSKVKILRDAYEEALKINKQNGKIIKEWERASVWSRGPRPAVSYNPTLGDWPSYHAPDYYSDRLGHLYQEKHFEDSLLDSYAQLKSLHDFADRAVGPYLMDQASVATMIDWELGKPIEVIANRLKAAKAIKRHKTNYQTWDEIYGLPA